MKVFPSNPSSLPFCQSTLKMSNMPLSGSSKSSVLLSVIKMFNFFQQLVRTLVAFPARTRQATPILPPLVGSKAVQTLHVLVQVWAQYRATRCLLASRSASLPAPLTSCRMAKGRLDVSAWLTQPRAQLKRSHMRISHRCLCAPMATSSSSEPVTSSRSAVRTCRTKEARLPNPTRM